MNYDLAADNSDDAGASQQVELDIEMYKDAFAEDYCRNLKQDLEAQVAFIDKLEEMTAEATEL